MVGGWLELVMLGLRLVWVGRWCGEVVSGGWSMREVGWGRTEGSQALTLPSLKSQVQQCKKEDAAGKKDSKGHRSLLCR